MEKKNAGIIVNMEGNTSTSTRRTKASLLLNPKTPPFFAVSLKFLASKHFLKPLSLSAEARLAPSFPHQPLFLSILNLFSFPQFPIASDSCPQI